MQYLSWEWPESWLHTTIFSQRFISRFGQSRIALKTCHKIILHKFLLPWTLKFDIDNGDNHEMIGGSRVTLVILLPLQLLRGAAVFYSLFFYSKHEYMARIRRDFLTFSQKLRALALIINAAPFQPPTETFLMWRSSRDEPLRTSAWEASFFCN